MNSAKFPMRELFSIRSMSSRIKRFDCTAKSMTIIVCGFTLIEVVVVAATAAALGAVAIPQYLGVRGRSEARAKAAAAVGIAKECSVLKSNDGSNLGVIDPATQANVTCDQESVAEITSQSWGVPQSVECVGSVVTATSVTLRVAATGEISCN